jgi:phosphorylase kinase alpha/beta subunit
MLLTSQIVRADGVPADVAYDSLMALSPSAIQQKIERVLENYHSLSDLPQRVEKLHAKGSHEKLSWKQDLGLEQIAEPSEGWLAWRQHQGIIDRRSSEFNQRIWLVLHHTPGLVIGNQMDKRNRIDSALVLSDMTPGETAFALLTENMLNNIHSAEYRQLSIEALEAMASFFEQNTSLVIDEPLAIDVTVGHAVKLAYLDQNPEHKGSYSDYKSDAWRDFYNRGPQETTGFIISALNYLLTENEES